MAQRPGTYRVAIVAGEASGDTLAAGLMQALQARMPEVRFEGVAGPQMRALGCEVLAPLEQLSVMGLVEVLGKLPELVLLRQRLVKHWRQNPPDIVIGVDAPDFTLGLELKLRQAGIKTIHYVSPSVWAWRQGRVKTMAKACDHVLTLFPFEAAFYQQHAIPVTCVGHTLADQIPMQVDQVAARQALNLTDKGPYIALLPGSRRAEVSYLSETLVRGAFLAWRWNKTLRFIVPAVNDAIAEAFTRVWKDWAPGLPVQVLRCSGREVMAAADYVVLASGTASLEAALLKRPMCVVYKLNNLSYNIYRKLVSVNHIALPNLLAEREIVPELIQEDATPEAVCAQINQFIAQPEAPEQQAVFNQIHHTLSRDADQQAAAVVARMLTE